MVFQKLPTQSVRESHFQLLHSVLRAQGCLSYLQGSSLSLAARRRDWARSGLGCPWAPSVMLLGLPACRVGATRASQESRRPFRLAEQRGLQKRGPGGWGARGNP